MNPTEAATKATQEAAKRATDTANEAIAKYQVADAIAKRTK